MWEHTPLMTTAEGLQAAKNAVRDSGVSRLPWSHGEFKDTGVYFEPCIEDCEQNLDYFDPRDWQEGFFICFQHR